MPPRAVLLVNPTAGRAGRRGTVGAVRARLAAAGWAVEVAQGRDAAGAADLARAAVAAGCDHLVVMGGDGIVHLALQAVAGSATALGVIPTGTGNDLARELAIPRGDPVAAAAVVAAGHTRVIDLARVGPVRYATVLAAGFDSVVNERANAMRWPAGQLRYTLATLAELRVFEPLPYSLELDGDRWSGEAMLVAVGNGSSYGGGLRMCEGAVIDDGLLDVVVIKPLGTLELARVYPRLFTGTHVSHPACERHRVREVSIAAPGIVAYADGERLGPLPLTVHVEPGAIAVSAPAP